MKPVMGVAEVFRAKALLRWLSTIKREHFLYVQGVTGVVQSVSVSTDFRIVKHEQLRLRRAIPIVPSSDQMVLVAYDPDAAAAQRWFIK